MEKGFVLFRDRKIPFVIENNRMELFTDDDSLREFTKEYNFKVNYILNGLCFSNGIVGEKATFFVERSVGNTCYLRCYIINVMATYEGYSTIGFQSPSLDVIFRYKYEYFDMVREGINLDIEPQDVYKIPFSLNNKEYEVSFRVGHDNRLGLLEDLDRKGELIVPLQIGDIQECYDIALVLYRLAMFMTSNKDVPFKRITLYQNNIKAGWFYSPFVSPEPSSSCDVLFHDFDVMKYIPKILNNIAMDAGNEITKSVPLGHLGNFHSQYSPQRFIEQVISFEYLFDKLEPKKAQDRNFYLIDELKYMFNEFPHLLSSPKVSIDDASEQIKKTRHNITHGHSYYYDFKNDSYAQYLMIILDRLIKSMSLCMMGFTKDEIVNYPVCL